MLARTYRFQGLGSVRAAMNHGDTTRAGLFTIKHLAQPRREHPRIGIIVSKKTAKRATVRNRIRRRIYGLFKTHWHLITRPIDIVVIVHESKVAEMPASELDDLFVKTLQKALAGNLK